jgi:lipopolysaccharide/colanic/teichoic acid biosynthesis glycosyltransferase/glycosyltransferase involved in cell wall biosynthesis
VDRVAAAIGLSFLLPLLPVVAIIIKLDTRGPALFRQRRIGRYGVPFTLYKLRTLRSDSDPYVLKPREGDARITRVGAFLRRRGWDELPQLVSVLTGDMSLVGPRPEMAFIADTYTRAERARLRVRPGITGCWQVMASRATPLRAGIAWDRYYLRHASLALDGWILLRTLGLTLGLVHPDRAMGRRHRTQRRLAHARSRPAVDRRVRVTEVLEAAAGGTLTHMTLLLGHIDRSKVDVRLVCSTTRGGDAESTVSEYRAAGIPVRVIDMVRRIDPLRDAVSALRLYLDFRRNAPDIVHTHSSKAGFVGRLAARLAGVPVIIHTPHGFAFQDDRRPWLQGVYAAIERLAGRWTTVLLCVSTDERALALEHRLVPASRTQVIYNSLDPRAADVVTSDQTLRATLGLPEHTRIIGTVANLRPEKGLDDFLNAARAMLDARDDLSFLIVGSGSLCAALHRQIQQLGLAGRVTIAASHDAIWPYLALMDVFVSASLREAMPYAILEAMAMRRAIVATAVTGSRELIRHGDTGWIVPPRQPAALARGVLQLLDDADLGAQLGARARQLVDSRHAMAGAIRSLEALYQDAARTAPPVRARVRPVRAAAANPHLSLEVED